MRRILDSINPQKIEKVAGSGNKFIHIVEGYSDYYLNLVPGFKYWDMCASEAIIRARYGLVSDAKRRPLYYIPNSTKFTIEQGIIAANNIWAYETNMQRMQYALQENIGIVQEEIC